MLRGQKERCQALRSSACRVDTNGISSSISDGSQSVHRHIKVLMTGLEERNAHCLEATRSEESPHTVWVTQTFTGHAGDSAAGWSYITLHKQHMHFQKALHCWRYMVWKKREFSIMTQEETANLILSSIVKITQQYQNTGIKVKLSIYLQCIYYFL